MKKWKYESKENLLDSIEIENYENKEKLITDKLQINTTNK